MNVLIVDDEPLAISRMERLLQRIDSISATYSAENGHQALTMVNLHKIDLIFLDIQMPGISGLEVAQKLKDMESQIPIIFTTAFDNFALDAFKVFASDYLLKPIKITAIEQSLSRLHKLGRLSSSKSSATFIKVVNQREIKRVDLNDVTYFRSEHKIVYVGLKSDQEVTAEQNLKEIELQLNSNFIRIHRNCIVAADAIEKVFKDDDEQHWLNIKNHEQPFSISRRHASDIKKIL